VTGLDVLVAGDLLRALAATLFALFLWRWARVYSRPGLREWSLSWWALAASLVFAAVASPAQAGGQGDVLYAVLPLVGLAARYWHMALFVAGTYAMVRLEPPPRRPLALALFTLLIVALASSPPLLSAAAAARLGWAARSLLVGAAGVATGVWILRRAHTRGRVGARLTALASLAYGLELLYLLWLRLTVATAGTAGAGSRLVLRDEAELLLIGVGGVAMIVWLLEEERETALSAADAARQSQVALRASERRFRALIEKSLDGIVLVSADGTVLERVSAVKPTALVDDRDVLGHSLLDFIHPDDLARFEKAFGECLDRPGSTLPLLLRLQAGGRIVTHEGTFTNMLDDPDVGAVVLHNRDVTESVRAQQELRLSEQRYRVLFENNPAPTWLYDETSLAILDVNRAAEQAYGYTRDEFRALTIRDIRPPEELPRLEAVLRSMPDSLPDASIWTHRRKDGSRFLVETSSHRLRLGERSLRVTIARDVTERERAAAEGARLQAAVEGAATEWKETFDAVDLSLVLLGPDGSVIRLNRSASEGLGREIHDCVGRHLTELSNAEPWTTVLAVAERARSSASPVGAVCREAAHGRTWGVSASAFSPGGDAPGRSVVAIRDLTAVVKLEESLRREEAMSAMGALVAGVAHEVRNPLFGISSTLDAMEARFGKQGPYERYLETLRAQVSRLSQLMTDLLDYGKPLTPSLAQQDVGALLREALQFCEPLAGRAGVRLEPHIDPALPSASLDRGRVLQVLQNLIQNAVQHSPGGAHVVIEASEDERAGRRGVRFAVRDEGPGFGPLDLTRLFEPFFTKRRGGTGLGLSIVQRIVEQHGGAVAAQNAPQGGGLVTVWMPLDGGAVPEPAARG
jgi:PAS domain S-box-containing protein